MSFFSRNENFIRIKFYSGMRGMSLQERIVYYNKQLKSETLLRLNQYLKSQRGLPDPQLEISQKKSDYEEILKLLKDFEFDVIIKSIFFEKNADQLFYHLKDIIIESVPVTFFDEYNILDLVKKPTNSQEKIDVSDYILSVFIADLDINMNDWNSESKVRHQTIYKLCDWLDHRLVEEGCENQIIRVLFYYTKYWNIYFARASDDAKRIVFLNKLSELIELKGRKFVININYILQRLSSELNKVLSDYSLPPFLVTKEYLLIENIKISTGYEIQLNRYLYALNEINKYFIDSSTITFMELIEKYFELSDSQKHLSSLIFKKMNQGDLPNIEELEYFKKLYALKKTHENDFVDSQNLIPQFLRRNYLFDDLDIE